MPPGFLSILNGPGPKKAEPKSPSQQPAVSQPAAAQDIPNDDTNKDKMASSSSSPYPVVHLRSETKPLEHRSALTPSTAEALIKAGYTVHVERSPVRVFEDAEFEAVGAKLVPEGCWPDAPKDHIILGLKELEEKEFPLVHTHIQFAHCYKHQAGWETVLARFPRGGGTLLDLEFLVNEKGRRVAAFGFHAGFAGAALAIEVWAWQLTHPRSEPFPGVSSYPNEDALMADVRKALVDGRRVAGRVPRVIVIGALGRCGAGAISALEKAGVPEENILKWDKAETAVGGPFREITESDIFVNCIFLGYEIPNFVTKTSLQSAYRKCSVVCDVSADTTSPHNPVPIYNVATTFDNPTVPVEVQGELPLSVISIDHLPSLLPREASEAFTHDLLPFLLELKDWHNSPVWSRAETLFKEKVATLPDTALQK